MNKVWGDVGWFTALGHVMQDYVKVLLRYDYWHSTAIASMAYPAAF